MVSDDASNIGKIEEDSFGGDAYFPTIVFNSKVADAKALNTHLLAQIYAERERDQKGIVRSNFRGLGGWHSHNNLHKEAAYKPLTNRIHQAGRRISRQLGYHPDKSWTPAKTYHLRLDYDSLRPRRYAYDSQRSVFPFRAS